MSFRVKTGAAARLAALVMVSLLAGCASVATPQAQVRQLAQQRWEALIKGDLDAAYGYFSPSYRALVPAERFKSEIGTAVRWESAEVELVTCDVLEKCTAQVKVESKPLAVPRFQSTITSHLKETWLLEGGRWWFHQGL